MSKRRGSGKKKSSGSPQGSPSPTVSPPASPPLVEPSKRLKRGQDVTQQLNAMISKSPAKSESGPSKIVIGIGDEMTRYCNEHNISENGNIGMLGFMTHQQAQDNLFDFKCARGHQFTVKGRTFYQERSNRENNTGKKLSSPENLCKGCKEVPEYKTTIITSYQQLVDHNVIASHSVEDTKKKVMNVPTFNDISHNELDFIHKACGHTGKVSLSLLYNAGKGLDVQDKDKAEKFKINPCSKSTCGDTLKSKQTVKSSWARFGKDHCSNVNDQFIENEMEQFDRLGSNQYHGRRVQVIKDCGCPYTVTGSYLYSYGGTANCPCESTIKQDLTGKFTALEKEKVIAIRNETIDQLVDRINSTPQELVRLLKVSYVNLKCGHLAEATMNFFYRYSLDELLENHDLLTCTQCNPGLMVQKVLGCLDEVFSFLQVDPLSNENSRVREKLKKDGVKNSTIFIKDKRGHTLALLAITLYNGNTPLNSLLKCDQCEQHDIIVDMVSEFVGSVNASCEESELVSPSVIQEVDLSTSPLSYVIGYKLASCSCPQFCTVNGLINHQGDPMKCVGCNPPKITSQPIEELGFKIEEPNHMNNYGRAPRLVCPHGHPKTDQTNKLWCSVCSAGAIMLEVYGRDAIVAFLSIEDPLGEYFEFTSKNYLADSGIKSFDDSRLRWIQAENQDGENVVVKKNSKNGRLKALVLEFDETAHFTSSPKKLKDGGKNDLYTDGKMVDQSVARLGSRFFDKLAPDQRVNGFRDCIAICVSEMVTNNVKNSIFISDSSYTDMEHYQNKENIVDLSDSFVWSGQAPYSEWSLKKLGVANYRLFSYGTIIHKNINFENKTLDNFFGGGLSKVSEPLELDLNFKFSTIKSFQSFKVSFRRETSLATVVKVSNVYALFVSSKYQEVFSLVKSCIEIQDIKPMGFFVKQSPSSNSNQIFDCLKHWVPYFLDSTFSSTSFSPPLFLSSASSSLSLNQKLAIIFQNLSVAFEVANKIHKQ